jgi:phage-related tail protein
MTAFTDLWTSAVEGWEGIKTSIGGAIDYVTTKWDTFVGKLQSAIQTAQEVGAAISEALSLGEGTVAGNALTSGLVNGMLSGRSTALEAGKSLGMSAGQGLREYLGINSPSRLAAGYGVNVAEGLAQGMEEGKGLVGEAARTLTDTAAGAMKGIGDLGSRIGDMFATAAKNVLTGVQSLREAVGQLLQQLAKMLINSAMKQLFGGLFKGLNLGGLPGYASGTMSAASGLALVGEQGPELVQMRGGERVYDARQTDRMLGGGESGGATQVTSNVYLDGTLILSQIETVEGEQAVGRVMRKLGR